MFSSSEHRVNLRWSRDQSSVNLAFVFVHSPAFAEKLPEKTLSINREKRLNREIEPGEEIESWSTRHEALSPLVPGKDLADDDSSARDAYVIRTGSGAPGQLLCEG